MQTVPIEFEDRRFRYTQIERHGDIAVYEQKHKKSGVVRYEVVRVRVAPAEILPRGTQLPEREVYPNAREWGRHGWTFYTPAEAQAHAQSLLQQASTGGVLASVK